MVAVTTRVPVVEIDLRDLSLSCPRIFMQLVVIVGNRWMQQLHPAFERHDCAARFVVPEEAAVLTVFYYCFWTFTFMIAPGAGTYARRTP